MKNVENYLINCEHDGSFISVNEVKRLLDICQKESYNEALDDAYELSKAKYICGESGYLDKKSINILKK